MFKKTDHKIGVLLPQSNAHPLMGKSFINGLRIATQGLDCQFIIEGIGLGSDPKQLINSFQKICYQENTILTTGIFGHYGFKELADFVTNNQEILIAANFGSHLPIKLPLGVYQNSLGLCNGLVDLTDYFSKNNTHTIATSTCYYEAGYGFVEALNKNPSVSFAGHFITPLHPRENESELMKDFFSEMNPDAIIAFHNGLFAKEHASYLMENKLYDRFPIYSLPFSCEDALIRQFPDMFNAIKSVSSWYPEFENAANDHFVKTYTKEYQKTPDFFALLGYENGLIIKNALLEQTNTISDVLQKLQIQGPRGTINFDNIYNKTNFDSYIWKNTTTDSSNFDRSIEQKLSTTRTTPEFSYTNEDIHGWYNSYLCH